MLRNIKPVDLLSIMFIACMAVVTLFALPRLPHGSLLFARYIALMAVLVIISRTAGHPDGAKWARALHAFLPVILIPVLFNSMGDLIPWIWPHYFDELLITIDFSLFGGHHPTVLLERFIRPWLTTIMQFAYISYYPMTIVLAVVLLVKKKETVFNEAVFGIILCFYLSYIGYLLVPAVGPRFTLAHLQTRDLAASPLVIALQDTLNTLENTKTDAFPSGHTAVALMTLYYAWKFRERVLVALLIPSVAGLIVSTVYLRYHYVIDVIAGIALTVLTVYLARPLSALLSRAAGHPADQLHYPS
ncbi:MAG: phosphatase PAP2 family protein [Nitrospirota bacterium]